MHLRYVKGDWVRRDSGVGAGIDSYYEYLLKGYVLLGDESYLDRFNTVSDIILIVILLSIGYEPEEEVKKNIFFSALQRRYEIPISNSHSP